MLALLLLLSLAFSLEGVQTWAARKAISIVNQDFNTEIQLGRLKYKWPNRVGLYEVYLPSDGGDTVVYIAEGEVGFLGYSDADYTLALSHIHTDGMKLIQRVDPGDSVNAFMRFIDKLTEDTTSSGRTFHFFADDIELKNLQYRFLVPSDTAFFLAYNEGYLHASNLRVDGPQVDATFEELSFLDNEIFVGGPVEQNTLHFIYFGEKKLEDSISIGADLWWGGAFEDLVKNLKTGIMNPESVRFFIGYSGWASGQLSDELSENTWIISDAKLEEEFLQNTPDELWRSVLKNMGGEFKVMANYPLDPRLN